MVAHAACRQACVYRLAGNTLCKSTMHSNVLLIGCSTLRAGSLHFMTVAMVYASAQVTT